MSAEILSHGTAALKIAFRIYSSTTLQGQFVWLPTAFVWPSSLVLTPGQSVQAFIDGVWLGGRDHIQDGRSPAKEA